MTNEVPKNKRQIPEINFFCPSERSEESILTTASFLSSFTTLRSVQDDNENMVKTLKINRSPFITQHLSFILSL